MPDDLRFTVWIPDGHSWRVLSQYPTRREADKTASRLKADGERCAVTETGDARDVRIRAGKDRPRVSR